MSDTKNALNYKPATLKVAGLSASRPGDFYIEFSFRKSLFHPFERFRKTYDLNRIDNTEQRRIVADLMIEAINELLEEGINPEGKDVQQYLSNVATKDALNQALRDV